MKSTTVCLFIYFWILLGSQAIASSSDSTVEKLKNFHPTIGSQKTLWVSGALKNDITQAIGQKPKKIREKYWIDQQHQSTRIFVLEQIGKIKDITAAWVIQAGKILDCKVLVYRESRGGEVQFPFFTDRFKGIGLKDSNKELDRHVDSISGATMSVDAMKRMAKQALLMDRHLAQKAP